MSGQEHVKGKDQQALNGTGKQQVQQQAVEMATSWRSAQRWQGIIRPYTPEEVLRLRGSVQIEQTLARLGAERLY